MRDKRSIVLLIGAVAFALLPLLFTLGGCASMAPGSDPIVVKTQDVLTNSLTLYETTMDLHFKHSAQEPPDVYKALEKVRPAFPRAWRALDVSLTTYQAAKTKDPAQLRRATLLFLDEAERDGPEDWKAAIRAIRSFFTAEAP